MSGQYIVGLDPAGNPIYSDNYDDVELYNDGDSHSSNKPLVLDSSDDAISKLAKDLNMKLDDETKDYLTQYYLNERSNKNAWDRQMDASNTQYQRAVADLRKAGINPFLALQSLSGSSPTSSGQSVQGGLYTSRKNQVDQNSKDVVTRIMTVLGVVAAAIISAML